MFIEGICKSWIHFPPSSWIRHTGETFDEQTLDSSDLMFWCFRIGGNKRNSSPKFGQIQLVGLFLGLSQKKSRKGPDSSLQKVHFQDWTEIHVKTTPNVRCFTKIGEKPPAKMSYCWWFRNPANQWRLVLYPIIYKVLYIQTVVVWDFFNIGVFRWGRRFSTWATDGVAGRWSQVHRWELSWVALWPFLP